MNKFGKRPEKPSVNGIRAEFIKKYKTDGYEVAKKEINSKFKKEEVYNDTILKGWIKEEEQR